MNFESGTKRTTLHTTGRHGEHCSASRLELSEVFSYITLHCNLRCKHCYLGDHLVSGGHGDSKAVIQRIGHSLNRGARRLTILGGEPTLHPEFGTILRAASEMGFSRVVVDTNGVAGNPVPSDLMVSAVLAVRIGLDGANPVTHDSLRGAGAYNAALRTLHMLVERGVRVEVTFTIHAGNRNEIAEAVRMLHLLGVSEVNFHFLSLLGAARRQSQLWLTTGDILQAQEDLTSCQREFPSFIRFPRLLVPGGQLPQAVNEGHVCRLHTKDVELHFPDGGVLHCPLQIGRLTPAKLHSHDLRRSGGCQYAGLLLPDLQQTDTEMTCISWKRVAS